MGLLPDSSDLAVKRETNELSKKTIGTSCAIETKIMPDQPNKRSHQENMSVP